MLRGAALGLGKSPLRCLPSKQLMNIFSLDFFCCHRASRALEFFGTTLSVSPHAVVLFIYFLYIPNQRVYGYLYCTLSGALVLCRAAQRWHRLLFSFSMVLSRLAVKTLLIHLVDKFQNILFNQPLLWCCNKLVLDL
jgi:cell shape-determining protein MreD